MIKSHGTFGKTGSYPFKAIRYNHLLSIKFLQMEKSLLMLNTSTGSFLIDTNTIVRIEASSNYSKIYFSPAMDGRQMLVTAKVLKWFEERLPGQYFIRLNRSHLVNNCFLQFHQSTGKAFELQNGKVIQVSRRRRKLLSMKFLLPQPIHTLTQPELLPPAC
jgi:DNA-binding LytR/AlgR family response regulator